MKTTVTKWATKAAGAGAVALLLATPAFAQSRGDWNRNNNSNRGAQATQQTRDGNRSRDQFNNNSYRNNNSSSYRENQRFTETGRITSFNREREGYRVNLDRGRSYWVPESRGHGLRTGLSVSIGGIFRGGSVFVDTLGYPAYDNGYVRGVVEGVNYRTGTVWLRDDMSGRQISAAVGSGYAVRSLHRGEFVELTGQWLGNGMFDVARIASIR